jgi:hypothetical protein
MASDAEQVLEQILWVAARWRDELGERGPRPGAGDSPSLVREYIMGALDALAAAGSLPAEEAAAYLQRARGLAAGGGEHREEYRSPPVPGSARRRDVKVATLSDPGGHEQPSPVGPGGSRLLRTIPGPAGSRPWRGGRLRIVSVDVYEAGIVVHWESDEPPILTEEQLAECEQAGSKFLGPGRRGHRNLRAWTLQNPQALTMKDDAGNTYYTNGPSSTGGDTFRTGTVVFVRSIDDDVESLTIDLDDASFEVGLER